MNFKWQEPRFPTNAYLEIFIAKERLEIRSDSFIVKLMSWTNLSYWRQVRHHFHPHRLHWLHLDVHLALHLHWNQQFVLCSHPNLGLYWIQTLRDTINSKMRKCRPIWDIKFSQSTNMGPKLRGAWVGGALSTFQKSNLCPLKNYNVIFWHE